MSTWGALLAPLLRLKVKFSIVPRSKSHIQLRNRQMFLLHVTPNTHATQALPVPRSWLSWDGTHPLSSAFKAPRPSLPPGARGTPLCSSPHPPSCPPARFHSSQSSYSVTSSWVTTRPSHFKTDCLKAKNWKQLNCLSRKRGLV